MSVQTSNRLTDLAERIRQAQDRAKVASVESAEQYLEAGRLLIEAKAECPHGEWLPFLEMTGVHERQARRLMQIARSGLKADTVSEMGGVKAALEHLAEQAQPETDPWEWAKQQLTGPFDGWDITEDNRNWLVSKFTYHANVPVVVAFGLDTYGEYKLATLRMASTADLAQSIYALAPYAKGDAEVDFKSLTPHHMMKLAISIMRVVELPVEDEAEVRPPEFSDENLALRFATARGDDLKYIAAWGRWYQWSGVAWAPDDTLAAYDLVRHECRAGAADLTARDTSATAKRQAASVASAKAVAAVERLARSDRRLAATVSQWDSEREVFTTPGGSNDD